VQRKNAVTKCIHGDAADEGHHAHLESQIEAVPKTQVELGESSLQHAAGHHVENRPHRVGRRDTNRNDQENQQLHRELHPSRRLVGCPGESDGLAVEEHVVDEA